MAKQANVVLVADPGAGAGDGFMRVVVRARNRCGVAQGSILCLNYGMEYDHQAVAELEQRNSSVPKRLRGLLDQFFAKLGAEQSAAAEAAGIAAATHAQGAALQAASEQASTGNAAGAIATGAAAGQTPGAAGATLPEASTATGAGSSAAAAAVAGAGSSAAAAAAVAGAGSSAAAAAAVAGAGSSVAAAGTGPSAAAAGAGAALRAGEKVAGEISKPLKATLIYVEATSDKPASFRIAANEALTTNKKIPPNTIWMHARDGKVLPNIDGVKFEFKTTKKVHVAEKASLGGWLGQSPRITKFQNRPKFLVRASGQPPAVFEGVVLRGSARDIAKV